MRLVYRPNHPSANENGMVDLEVAGPPASAPATYVISDEMDATQHMASGRYLTSKKKFRDETKAYGCVELGNDVYTQKPRQLVKLDRRERREAIQRAIYELRNRS